MTKSTRFLSSLKWKIVSKFSALLLMLMVAINVGFVIWVLIEAPSVNGPDTSLEASIADSLAYVGEKLIVASTDEIDAVKSKSPNFWFTAIDFNGNQVTFGNPPQELKPLLSRLPTLMQVNIIEGHDSPLTVVLAYTTIGEHNLRLVYGGSSMPGSHFANIIYLLKALYLPTIIVPFMMALVVLPILVKKSLSGLEEVVTQAEKIDLRTTNNRINPIKPVSELIPLIDAFNQALERISEEFQLRQRFISDAAHELRTPITILQTRIEAQPESENRDKLLRDVKRMHGVAEQLLDIQRFSIMHHMAAVDLVPLCRNAVAAIAPIAYDSGIEMGFHSDRTAAIITADEKSIERAIFNLLNNAIEHSGDADQISLEIDEFGAVFVADNGVGIPTEHEDKIFSPFYRCIPKQTGSGLGLSLVSEIAKVHGGTISLVRTTKGATFKLLIPLS